jgi:hypothetical protein
MFKLRLKWLMWVSCNDMEDVLQKMIIKGSLYQLVMPPSGQQQLATILSGQQQPVGESAEAQPASAVPPPRAGPACSDERREAQLASAAPLPRAGPWRGKDRREAQVAPVHQPPQEE